MQARKFMLVRYNKMPWWAGAVIYQIYPRSFADSNGDGIGDLQGIIDHLEYLAGLGIDAIWLCPHYPSPNVDGGYDISDYQNVASEYGTLDDFKRLIDAAHAKRIRIITDLVLNHTSTQHPWFKESRSSRENPKRDWYVWADGKNGGPPNNWLSDYGGSAWELDTATGQYYYHFFFKEQADLNWRNPEVKKAMFDVARFWLELGVDGFRLDAVGTIYENPTMADHKSSLRPRTGPLLMPMSGENVDWLLAERKVAIQHQIDQPGLHELLHELRQVVDEYPDKVLIGESEEISYLGDGENELNLVFGKLQWGTQNSLCGNPRQLQAEQIERLAAMPTGGWQINAIGSHDGGRDISIDHSAEDEFRIRQKIFLALTLRGTPLIYYGNEIGMTNLIINDPALLQDELARLVYKAEIEIGTSPKGALRRAASFSRDRSRSPMQWSSVCNAGFTLPGVKTWLSVNADYCKGINVIDEEGKTDSRLEFVRTLIRLRRENPALIHGDYEPIDTESEEYIAFKRCDTENGQTVLVVINMSEKEICLNSISKELRWELLYSSNTGRESMCGLNPLKLSAREIFLARSLL
jgi:alpha-glucosidase